ncbi:AlwI family type II restriction endonuclease [Helicobacter pylori]|uniref:AlwI family type II restriction endonuclease n=1 Tax=Helicobacter pylori TaxID=210 RepID=UPI0013F42834|nr:AlwI family type II restriction endonuclease [Helicobacter pylori]NHB23320.1 AlwI family type II restriction endonuclease [Helicobacter pylori]
MTKKPARKILSFSTTMRNPKRIGQFLAVLEKFENQILKSSTIMQIIKSILAHRLYRPTSINQNKELKEKFDSNEYVFSDEELERIIEISPQNHKEMGFEHGWESRFDTWYKLMCEFGFCYYAKYEKILISDSAKMLILAYYDKENDAFKESVDESVVGAIFLNALSKYEVGNPYKKNLNHNNPFKLLLSLLKRLKNANLTPLSVKEIPILLCWKDDNANGLYDYIVHLRQEIVTINKTEFSYSDEFIYEKCLKLLESVNKTRFKMSQITNEAVDEYIRKMRITGLISLRGNGRFIDINTNESNKIDYILQTYKTFKGDYLNDTQANRLAFFNYMAIVDSFLVSVTPISDNESVKSSKLNELATTYTKDFIKQELLITCNKQESKDNFLRLIDKPLRLEFLSAIFLKQHFENLSVMPNYKSDDEGLPVYTASGNKPDIVAMDTKAQSYIEVSLIRDRSQSALEMIPIARHLKELIKNSADIREKFSVFVAPNIHDDAKEYAGFAHFKDNINIRCYAINDFIKKVENSAELLQLNDNPKA